MTQSIPRLVRQLISLALLATPSVSLAQFDHGLWQELLDRYVVVIDGGQATRVDYSGIQNEQQKLQGYLERLAAVEKSEFERWQRSEQLAFLINAYNAWTVETVLSEYPKLESIRDLGWFLRPVWGQLRISLFGEQISLDYLEHDLIRGPEGYGEPRIHFAVNCASIGCPALRNEAYTGDRLEEQLEDATSLFLADRSRNRLENGTLWVSEIFSWYEKDFEQGWRDTDSVAEFLARYAGALGLSDQDLRRLLSGQLRIRTLDYDWSLNDSNR